MGQRVWVYTPRSKKGLSKKLLHNWLGPYRIVEKSSPVHFRLRTDTNKKVTFAVHANRMKPFVDPNLRPIDPPLSYDPSEPDLDESDFPKDCFEPEVPVVENASANEHLQVSNSRENSLLSEDENRLEQSQSHPDDIVTDDETVFRAEKILKSRRKKGKMQYLVKWFDFPMSESTWEPEENILDKRLIDVFRRSRKYFTVFMSFTCCLFVSFLGIKIVLLVIFE